MKAISTLVIALTGPIVLLTPTLAHADGNNFDPRVDVRGAKGSVVVAADGVQPGKDGKRVGSGVSRRAPCHNCHIVRAVPQCGANQGGSSPGDAALCTGAAVLCQPGEIRNRVFVRDPVTGNWQPGVSYCVAGSAVGASTPPDVSLFVRERLVRALPASGPSFQPKFGALLNVPTIFDSRQRPQWSATVSILGQPVAVTATASWRWSWGDGTSETVISPGGAYPDMSVTHTYRDPGTVHVQVTTVWTATYSVAGAARGQVPGGAIELVGAPLTLRVVEARSELIAG